nr:hypothetical protein CFP56_69077 [Quercus suber]
MVWWRAVPFEAKWQVPRSKCEFGRQDHELALALLIEGDTSTKPSATLPLCTWHQKTQPLTSSPRRGVLGAMEAGAKILCTAWLVCPSVCGAVVASITSWLSHCRLRALQLASGIGREPSDDLPCAKLAIAARVALSYAEPYCELGVRIGPGVCDRPPISPFSNNLCPPSLSSASNLLCFL